MQEVRSVENKTGWQAAMQGMSFDIDGPYLFSIYPKDGMCPALKVPFVLGRGWGNPFAPSVDRIDPQKGYVRGNIAIISSRANAIKHNASGSELRMIADWIDSSMEKKIG